METDAKTRRKGRIVQRRKMRKKKRGQITRRKEKRKKIIDKNRKRRSGVRDITRQTNPTKQHTGKFQTTNLIKPLKTYTSQEYLCLSEGFYTTTITTIPFSILNRLRHAHPPPPPPPSPPQERRAW
ncbi:hypothetical protein E2C01_073791 [Portunus trituberculatus]|uniref:Uncharacterized protein n=1 Tax=Portunus trituberculatus TaxID=210409 RepID=A0A5B7IAE5_PORTR|nr:hypothetical protein [Portunus trituberculatus]